MTDLRETVVPKSDQLNADDLIGGPITIHITKVSLLAGEQPVGIGFEGDNGKPYKPCKSMRRVLIKVWGSDGNAYVGRSMTLYRDDTVRFGGVDVGGIRISHMSGLDKPITMALTATRAQRKPYTVRPLTAPPPPAEKPAEDKVEAGVRTLIERINAATPTELETITAEPDVIKQRAWLTKHRPDAARRVADAIAERLGAMGENDGAPAIAAPPPDDDGFPAGVMPE